MIDDEERQRSEARAAELGYANVETYLLALLQADVERPLSEEIENELIEALATPAREMTPADWDEKRRRLIESHRQAKAG